MVSPLVECIINAVRILADAFRAGVNQIRVKQSFIGPGSLTPIRHKKIGVGVLSFGDDRLGLRNPLPIPIGHYHNDHAFWPYKLHHFFEFFGFQLVIGAES